MRIRGIPADVAVRLLLRPARLPPGPVHVFLCIADHFEPAWHGAGRQAQQERVLRWTRAYPTLSAPFVDSAGRRPRHTFFYPAEQYHPALLDPLAELCHSGWGDVEIHLHHDRDTRENLRETLQSFASQLSSRHGLLRRDEWGAIRYGFIHGNWALNNCRPDGRWCGVDDELSVLAESGCYADFTMPAAPSPAQPRAVNQLYYADCRPEAGRNAHACGKAAAVGQLPPPDGLLMVQGPLLFDWSRRKWGCLPKLENGDLRAGNAPSLSRLAAWVSAGIHVQGRPEWIFVKLHTHGAPEANAEMLLGQPMRQFHEDLARLAQSTELFRYYYVTAHEMAQLIHQAERGQTEPQFDDFSDKRERPLHTTAKRARPEIADPAAGR